MELTKHEPITYTWKNINVHSPAKKKSLFGGSGCEAKHILKNVSGVARPSELVAIMGASGAGKTSLLNVLTFRNLSNLQVTGETCVNGVPLNREMLQSVAAYVQQDDLFVGGLTVREHLTFQARLQMRSEIPMAVRMKRVEQVMDELGLTKCADTIIGIPGRLKGISGGEKKRLSFASEVLTDPPLMFCDEPTSGLDSYMAENVISVLKTLAQRGKTIICTIHQPSSQVYAMFDRVLLMAEGRTAYLGDASEALGFFERLGYPCPPTYNPSDYFIEILAIQPGKVEECKARAQQICDAYDKSPEAADVEKTALQSARRGSELPQLKAAMTQRSPYKASWFAQVGSVIWRTWRSSIRDPMAVKIRLVMTIIISVLFGLIFLREDYNQAGIQNINGALFLVIINSNFQNLTAVLNVFCPEIPVFLREHFNGMYSTHAYYIGKTLAELPGFIVIPFVYVTISYWMMGFNDDVTRYLIFTAVLLLFTNISCAYGYVLSCLSSSIEVAMALAPVLLMPFFVLGGFFANAGTIPVYFSWIKYISWIFYANEVLLVNQWDGVTDLECERENNATCISTGIQVLESLSFDKDNQVRDVIMMGVLFFVFHAIAFLLLLRRSYRK